MLFISPPFGNYINLPYTKSIKGSFTLNQRKGLILQIFKTLRYNFLYKGWINKIGLKNNGIDWAINKYKYDNNSIISIAILDHTEIEPLNQKIPKNMNLEINISCPNVINNLIHDDLNKFLNPQRKWCAIKLSPTTDFKLITKYYNQGFRIFHCSNTLSTNYGGLSGITLQKYTIPLIKKIKSNYPDTTIIAGGGITYYSDLLMYQNYGADYFSISTLLFNPIRFIIFYYNYYTNLH